MIWRWKISASNLCQFPPSLCTLPSCYDAPGTNGTDVTFSSALTDADYVVLYEQQALSGKAKFESRSIGEISTENKTVNGFTVKSSDNLIGVTVRYAVITY